MAKVLHILPHPGGGGERYVDLLSGLDGFDAARAYVTAERGWLAGAPGIATGLAGNARRARAADVSHVHGDTAAILSWPLLAAPSLWTTHGLHLLRRCEGARLALVRRALAATVRRATFTVCCSASERDELAAFLPAALHPRLRVVVNGVELPDEPDGQERLRVRAGLGIAPDRVVALYLGELEPRKDPLGAVAATERARERGAPLVLLVAGDGELRGEVEARASDGVRVLGHRSDADRLLLAADVLCLPSAREGLSFAVLEAMAHGLAPVLSDIPGNREAVGDGAGLLVPVGATERLTDALLRLSTDTAERTRLGAAARERVGAEFRLDAMRRDTVALYREALGRPA